MNPKQLEKDFGIPQMIRGKTPAEKAAFTEKIFKERPFDVKTKEEILAAIANWQEYTKMQDGMQRQSQEVPDQMNGQIPSGMEQYIQPNTQINQHFGGYTGGGDGGGTELSTTSADADVSNANIGGIPIGLIIQAAKDLTNNIAKGIDDIGTANKMDDSGQNYMDPNTKLSAGDITKKMQTPGGFIPDVAGFFTGATRKRKDKIAQNNINFALGANRQNIDSLGGYNSAYGRTGINNYAGGTTGINYLDFLTPEETRKTQVTEEQERTLLSPEEQKATTDKALKRKERWKKIGKLGLEAASLSPIIGNLTDKLERTDAPRRDRLFGNADLNLLNMEAALNPVKDVWKTTMNSARSISGGDKAGIQALLSGLGTAGSRAIGERASGVDAVNMGERARQQELMYKIGQTNIGQSNLDETDKQANDAAFETAKNVKRTALFEDIAKKATEIQDKARVKDMFGYSWDGEYVRDAKGKIVNNSAGKPMTKDEFDNLQGAINSATSGEGDEGASSGSEGKSSKEEKGRPSAPNTEKTGFDEVNTEDDEDDWGYENGEWKLNGKVVTQKAINDYLRKRYNIPEEAASSKIEAVKNNITPIPIDDKPNEFTYAGSNMSTSKTNLLTNSNTEAKTSEQRMGKYSEMALESTSLDGQKEAISEIEKLDPEVTRNPVAYALKYLGFDENNVKQQETIKGFYESALGEEMADDFVPNSSDVTKNSKAWCAAFVTSVLKHYKVEIPESIHKNSPSGAKNDVFDHVRAKQYANVGTEVNGFTEAKQGDIVVTVSFDRKGRAQYHVGFYSGMNGDIPTMLGGNQNNKVSVKDIPLDKKHKLVSIRRLDGVEWDAIPQDSIDKLYEGENYAPLLKDKQKTR